MHHPFNIFRVCLVLLQIPFLFLAHVLSNLLRLVAPKLTFNLALKLLNKVDVHSWINTEKIKTVDDMDFLFSVDIKKWKIRAEIGDILKPAKLGNYAPNPPVVDVSNKSSVSPLLSLAKEGRPFVLNFGSCT